MLSRGPTLPPPPSSAITAGYSAMSNPAARTPPYAPSVLAPMPKQSIAAPIQPARGVKISNQSSTAASPPPLAAPTAPKTTRQVTGIARPARYPSRTAPDAPEADEAAPSALSRPPQPASLPLPSTDPDAMDIQPDEAGLPAPSSTPPPPGLESPLEFATPSAPLRPALMGPSGSTSRTGRPQPDVEPSPSPASREHSPSRR